MNDNAFFFECTEICESHIGNVAIENRNTQKMNIKYDKKKKLLPLNTY